MKIELNRDQIKYIAVFTMLLNHVANIFLQPGTFACEALKDIGYFTAPVMCWFLVEGYRYTRSVKKYAGKTVRERTAGHTEIDPVKNEVFCVQNGNTKDPVF